MRKQYFYSLIFLTTLFFFVSPFGISVAHAGVGDWMLGLGKVLIAPLKFAAIPILAEIVEFAIVPIFSFFMTVFGLLFDQSVQFTLNTCNYAPRSFIGNSCEGIEAIDKSWSLIRDFVNISFIFIILYIAIQTILGISGPSTKKMLGGVVMSAILINFSMFIGAFIIDSGNLLATGLYNSIEESDVGNTTLIERTPLSNAVLSGVGMQSLYDPLNVTGTEQLINAAVRIVIFSIVTFAFIVASILFIARTIAFVFLLVLSPFGFIGWLLPAAKKYSRQWWKILAGQTFVAPVFLFFMYLIVLFSKEASQLFETADGSLSASTYLNMALIIGLMLGAVKITKDLSGKIGSAALKVGGMVGGLALGGSALALRAGGGALASRAMSGAGANKLRQIATDPTRGKTARLLARGTLKAGRGAETGTYDIRNVTKTKAFKATGLDKATGKIGSAGGLTFGSGLKQGHEDREKDKEKKGKEFEEKALRPRTTADMAEYKETGLYKLEEEKNKTEKERKEAEKAFESANDTHRRAPAGSPEKTEAATKRGEAYTKIQEKEQRIATLDSQIKAAPKEEKELRDNIAKDTGLRNDKGDLDAGEVSKYVESPTQYTQEQYAQTLREQTNLLGKALSAITFGFGDVTKNVQRLRTDADSLSDAEKARFKEAQKTRIGANKVSQKLAAHFEIESKKGEKERKQDDLISRLERVIRDASGDDEDDDKKS